MALTETQLADLADMVHDTADHDASEVVNSGEDKMFAYLLAHGWSEQQILEDLGIDHR